MANFVNIGKAGAFQVYFSAETGRVQMSDGNHSVTLGLDRSRDFMNAYQGFLYNNKGADKEMYFTLVWPNYRNG